MHTGTRYIEYTALKTLWNTSNCILRTTVDNTESFGNIWQSKSYLFTVEFERKSDVNLSILFLVWLPWARPYWISSEVSYIQPLFADEKSSILNSAEDRVIECACGLDVNEPRSQSGVHGGRVWKYWGKISKMPGPRRSKVWKYFEKQVNHCVCRLCNAQVQSKGGNTSNMMCHLRRKHGIDVQPHSA